MMTAGDWSDYADNFDKVRRITDAQVHSAGHELALFSILLVENSHFLILEYHINLNHINELKRFRDLHFLVPAPSPQ